MSIVLGLCKIQRQSYINLRWINNEGARFGRFYSQWSPNRYQEHSGTNANSQNRPIGLPSVCDESLNEFRSWSPNAFEPQNLADCKEGPRGFCPRRMNSGGILQFVSLST